MSRLIKGIALAFFATVLPCLGWGAEASWTTVTLPGAYDATASATAFGCGSNQGRIAGAEALLEAGKAKDFGTISYSGNSSTVGKLEAGEGDWVEVKDDGGNTIGYGMRLVDRSGTAGTAAIIVPESSIAADTKISRIRVKATICGSWDAGTTATGICAVGLGHVINGETMVAKTATEGSGGNNVDTQIIATLYYASAYTWTAQDKILLSFSVPSTVTGSKSYFIRVDELAYLTEDEYAKFPTPVVLADFGTSTAITDNTDGWVSVAAPGNTGAGGSSQTIKCGNVTLVSSGNNFASTTTTTFSSGTFVDSKKVEFNSILEEMQTTLGLKAPVPTGVYQDGIHSGWNGGGVATVTIDGLAPEQCYTLYAIGGTTEVANNPQFNLITYDTTKTPIINYATQKLTAYQTGSGVISASANDLLLVRVYNVYPNSDGIIAFKTDEENKDRTVKQGFNCVALAATFPVYTRTLESATETWTEAEDAITWSPAITKPADESAAVLTATVDTTLTVDSDASLGVLSINGEDVKLSGTDVTLSAITTVVNANTDVSGITGTTSLGNVTVASGKSLAIGANTTWSALSGSGKVVIDTDKVETVSNPIASAVEVIGSGEATISGNISGNNQTLTVTSGVVTLTHANTRRWAPTTIETGATLKLDDGATLLHASNYSNQDSPVIVKGCLELNNWGYGGSLGALSTRSDAVKLNGGTLKITGNTSASRLFNIESGGGTINVPKGIVFEVLEQTDGTNAEAYERINIANLYKKGAGKLIIGDLIANNGDYAGVIDVNEGALYLNFSANTYTGATTVASGATLGGSGNIPANLTLNDGAILDATTGALTVGGAVTQEGNLTIKVASTADADTTVLTCNTSTINTENISLVNAEGVEIDTLEVKANDNGTALVLAVPYTGEFEVADAAGITAALAKIKAANQNGTITLTKGVVITDTIVIDVGEGNSVTINLAGNSLTGADSMGTDPVIRIQSGTLNLVTTEAATVSSSSGTIVLVGAKDNALEELADEACALNLGAGVSAMTYGTSAVYVASGTIGGAGSTFGGVTLASGATLDASIGTTLTTTTASLPTTGALTVKLAAFPEDGATTEVLTLSNGGTLSADPAVETLTVIVGEESNATDYKLVMTETGYGVTALVDNTLPYQLTWLPVGDSITEGERYMGDTPADGADTGTYGGYRYQLWKQLDEDLGQDLRSVGFRVGHWGGTEDPEEVDWACHAALYGGDITGGSSGAQLFNVESTLEVVGYPDFISILIGINDLSRRPEDGVPIDNVDVTYESWAQLVDRYAKLRPNSKVLAATLLPTKSAAGNCGAEVATFNEKIRAAATAEPKLSPFDNPNVVLADIAERTGWGDEYVAETHAGYFKTDGLHPNLEGSEIIATAFRGVIEEEVLAPLKAATPTIVNVNNATAGKIAVRFNKPITSFMEGITLTITGTDVDGAYFEQSFTTCAIDSTDAHILNFSYTDEIAFKGGEYSAILQRTVTDVTGQTSGLYQSVTDGVEIYGSGAAENVPASFREGFIHRKTLAVAADANYGGETPTAAMTDGTGATTEVANIGKVAYYVELQREGKAPQFVWVSMDATAFNYSETIAGIPTESVGPLKKFVTDLDVYGNRGNFDTEVTGGQGVIEFSPYGCSGTDHDGFPAETHTNLTGWNDTLYDSGLYGIMQVARIRTERDTTKTVKFDPVAEMLFAFNGFNNSTGTDIAIGSMVVHRDYSGSTSATTISYDWERFYERTGYPDFNPTAYTVKNVEIWVEPAAAEVTESSWIAESEAAWEDAENWDNGVPKGMVNAIIPVGASITLNGAASAKSITIEGEEGTVTLTGAYALTVADAVALAEKQTLALTDGTILSATVRGAGTLLTTTLPGTVNGLTADTWSGNVELTNITVTDLDLRLYGRAGSTITLNGVSGYWGYNSDWSVIEIPANICIKGENTNNNGYSTQQYDLTGKITGSGTLEHTTAGGGKYCFTGNMSDFKGTLKTAFSGGQIAIGTETFTAGKITIGGTKTIACTLSATSGIVVETGATVTLSGKLDSATTVAETATVTLAKADAIPEGILAGAGTVKITEAANLPAVKIVNDSWTGNVELKDVSVSNLDLRLYGVTGSTITLDGVSGHLDWEIREGGSVGNPEDWVEITVPANICMKSLKLTNGYSDQAYNFTGAVFSENAEGTLTFADSCTGMYKFTGDISGFTGSIVNKATPSNAEKPSITIATSQQAESLLTEGAITIVGTQEINGSLTSSSGIIVKSDATISGTGSFLSEATFEEGATVDATDSTKLLTVGTATGTVNVKLADNATLPANVFKGTSYTPSLSVGTVTIGETTDTTNDYKFSGTGTYYQIDIAEAVCTVGGVPYSSLEDAVAAIQKAGNGGTITLTGSPMLTETIVVNVGDTNTLTIDLAGAYISSTATPVVLVKSGTLQLTTSNPSATGIGVNYIWATDEANTAIIVGDETSTDPKLVIGANVGVTSTADVTVDLVKGTIGGSGEIVNNLKLANGVKIDAMSAILTVGGVIVFPDKVSDGSGGTTKSTVTFLLPEDTRYPHVVVNCEDAKSTDAPETTLSVNDFSHSNYGLIEMYDNTTGLVSGYGLKQYVCAGDHGDYYASVDEAIRAGETAITLYEDTQEHITLPIGVKLTLTSTEYVGYSLTLVPHKVIGSITVESGATLEPIGGDIEGNLILEDGATLSVYNEVQYPDYYDFHVSGTVSFPAGTITVIAEDEGTTVALGVPKQIISTDVLLTPGATLEGTTVNVVSAAGEAASTTVKVISTSYTYEIVSKDSGPCTLDGVDYANLQQAINALATAFDDVITLKQDIALADATDPAVDGTLVIDVGAGNTAVIDLAGYDLTSTAEPAIRIESGSLEIINSSETAATISTSTATAILVGASDDTGTAVGADAGCILDIGANVTIAAATNAVNVVVGTVAGSGTLNATLVLADGAIVDATHGTLTMAEESNVTFPGTDAENKGTITVLPPAGKAYPMRFIACPVATADNYANTNLLIKMGTTTSAVGEFTFDLKKESETEGAAVTGYAIKTEYEALRVLENGTVYAYYATFAAAIEAAAATDTVVLLADVIMTEDVTTNIYTNGYNISGTSSETTYTINGQLTISQGTEIPSGTKLSASSIFISDDATVTINGSIASEKDILCSGMLEGTGTIAGTLFLADGAVIGGSTVIEPTEGTKIDANATVTIDGNLSGSLLAPNATIEGSGSITIQDGNTLTGNGNIYPTVTLADGATIDKVDYEDAHLILHSFTPLAEEDCIKVTIGALGHIINTKAVALSATNFVVTLGAESGYTLYTDQTAGDTVAVPVVAVNNGDYTLGVVKLNFVLGGADLGASIGTQLAAYGYRYGILAVKGVYSDSDPVAGFQLFNNVVNGFIGDYLVITYDFGVTGTTIIATTETTKDGDTTVTTVTKYVLVTAEVDGVYGSNTNSTLGHADYREGTRVELLDENGNVLTKVVDGATVPITGLTDDEAIAYGLISEGSSIPAGVKYFIVPYDTLFPAPAEGETTPPSTTKQFKVKATNEPQQDQ